jgi:TM2 domain-containing membrane protein YozV
MSQPYKACPRCATPALLDANSCSKCGHVFSTPFGGPGNQTQMYPGPPQGMPNWQQPYPVAPQVPYTGKEKIPAGLLALFLGPLGIHLFYLGQNGVGIAYLLFTLLTCGYGALITAPLSLVQGILYLCANDYDFQQKYVIERRFF